MRVKLKRQFICFFFVPGDGFLTFLGVFNGTALGNRDQDHLFTLKMNYNTNRHQTFSCHIMTKVRKFAFFLGGYTIRFFTSAEDNAFYLSKYFKIDRAYLSSMYYSVYYFYETFRIESGILNFRFPTRC